ncbi:hypothetical protein BTVI_76733 [Pitangus sulphuratus]|nr:hypothetical protein BTVI_76733 [Pitangus sulphuratus]
MGILFWMDRVLPSWAQHWAAALPIIKLKIRRFGLSKKIEHAALVNTIKHFYFPMTNDHGELEIVLPYKAQRNNLSIVPLCSSAHSIALCLPQIADWRIREAPSSAQLDPRVTHEEFFQTVSKVLKNINLLLTECGLLSRTQWLSPTSHYGKEQNPLISSAFKLTAFKLLTCYFSAQYFNYQSSGQGIYMERSYPMFKEEKLAKVEIHPEAKTLLLHLPDVWLHSRQSDFQVGL